MQLKNQRSKRIEQKKQEHAERAKEGDPPYEEGMKDFHSDEEPENN